MAARPWLVGRLLAINRHTDWEAFASDLRGWTPERLRRVESTATSPGGSLLEAACIARAPYGVIARLLELGASCVRAAPASDAREHLAALDILIVLTADEPLREDVFRLFVGQPGVDIETPIPQFLNASRFHFMLRQKIPAAVLEFVLETKRPSLERESEGQAALHIACQTSTLENVKLLLKHGADPDIRTSETHGTCLHMMMEIVRPVEFTRTLLAAGADPNLCDVLGNTALKMAAFYGPPAEHVRALFEYGAVATPVHPKQLKHAARRHRDSPLQSAERKALLQTLFAGGADGAEFSLADLALVCGHAHLVYLLSNPPARQLLLADCEHRCAHCGAARERLFQCCRCLGAWYCNPACQKNDWKKHKPICILHT